MGKLSYESIGDSPRFTPAEIAELRPHPAWADGRVGYQWCRFDAMLDASRRLRAEITWDDDQEFDANPNEDGTPTVYFSPQLFLEMNREEGPIWSDTLVTWDGVIVPLARDETRTAVESDPRELLTRFAEKIAALDVWDPSKGYGERVGDG